MPYRAQTDHLQPTVSTDALRAQRSVSKSTALVRLIIVNIVKKSQACWDARKKLKNDHVENTGKTNRNYENPQEPKRNINFNVCNNSNARRNTCTIFLWVKLIVLLERLKKKSSF